VSDDLVQQAQAYFNAGNFSRCQELARQGLAASPSDVRFLRLAGKCGLELDDGETATYLRQAAELEPDDADTWRDLAIALMDTGDLGGARDALQKALELRPNDTETLVDLGHTLFALRQTEEAISALSRAAELAPGNRGILRALLDMHRRTGGLQAALDVARQITQFQPDDVLACMDVGGLCLILGNVDESVAAYYRLRSIDPNPEHEVYAIHGMIQGEMQRERWRRALDLAVDATKVDRYGLTTELLAYAVAQVFGASDRPVPDREHIDAALAIEHIEHRRLHTEELSL
jgi:Flp pilus assembly protein TadD